jgi:hypothetical protein
MKKHIFLLSFFNAASLSLSSSESSDMNEPLCVPDRDDWEPDRANWEPGPLPTRCLTPSFAMSFQLPLLRALG